MGFLNFLNRRSIIDGASSRSVSLHNGRPMGTASVSSLRLTNVTSLSVSSTSATSRGQGHIDLLDAHGGIKPYDFRSRIQAAGVRDYGEDVAERNMGENGVDVQSAASKEFYERQRQRQRRHSTQTQSIMSYTREADQSTYGGSTYGGSEADDWSYIDNLTAKRPLSRLSLEPRHEVSGRVASRPVSRSVSEHHSSAQGTPRADRTGSTQSGARQNAGKHWISSGQKMTVLDRKSRRQSLPVRAKPQSRSISPPCVPRYRPGSSMAIMREEEDAQPSSHHRRRDTIRSRRSTATTGALTVAGDTRSILSREGGRQTPNFERSHLSDSEAETKFGVLPAIDRAATPQLMAVPPPTHQQYPEWQDAVRRVVEESLAQLPLSVDLKALMDLSHNGTTLNETAAQNVPLRRSSLQQASLTCSTPTTDYSDYASSHTGRPRSRHTAATSIDSSARMDAYQKTGSSIILDGRSSAGDDYQSSPTIAAVDEITGLAPTQLFKDVTYQSGVMDLEDFECIPSDFSDVDSFTEKRRRILNEEETILFPDDSFGDLSANLPGIVTQPTPNNCMVCNVLASLPGSQKSGAPCDHNGMMSPKQRLRALGYDYDSDESDSAPARIPSIKRSRTKKLTSGSGGGLRRLKLVDDRIEEASEEERAANDVSVPRPGVRRKSKFPNFSLAPLPAIVVREDGNIADME